MAISDNLKEAQLFILVSGFVGLAIGYVLSNYQHQKRTKEIPSRPLILPFSPEDAQDLHLQHDKSQKVFIPVNSDSKNARSILLELEKAFRVSKSDLENICLAFVEDLELGLSMSYTDDLFSDSTPKKEKEKLVKKSTVPMLPSFVENLPTGNEEGCYLAIDFGGTHVRIIKVTLFGGGECARPSTPSRGSSSNHRSVSSNFSMVQKKMIIPDEMKVGSGYDLFDYIAQGVCDFLQEHSICSLDTLSEKIVIPLGFTFSFGVQQKTIDSGVILGWNKDFKCDDVLGLDPVQLLQQSLKKKGLEQIKVVALVNDTTGTLVAHAFSEPTTQIAAILGTGSNAAYNESVDRIKKFSICENAKNPSMLINTEFGAFNPDFSPTGKEPKGKILSRTKYDIKIDSCSKNPNRQTYEKLISGHYIGEIVRVVLIDLIKRKKLFKNVSEYEEENFGLLGAEHSFNGSYMSRIERDHSGTLADTKSLLQDILKISHRIEISDLKLIKYVCELVAIRSARLASATLAGIIHHLGLARLLCAPISPLNDTTLPSSLSDDPIYVAIDGSLFEHYPHYSNRMMDAFRELFGSKADSIRLCLAKDGSGLGAALTAAVVYHPDEGHSNNDLTSQYKATPPFLKTPKAKGGHSKNNSPAKSQLLVQKAH